jgi:endonuclease-8
MPEGPEIRRVADRIERAIGGRVVTEVRFLFPHLMRFEDCLRGQIVTAVKTHGKAMLVQFSGGLCVYAHSQLYGRWYVISKRKLPKTNRSLRLEIHNNHKSALLYSASEIDVLTPEQVRRHQFLSKLGPDVLAQDVDEHVILNRITDRRFARRQLHALLLDQGFVAGLGNYLRSEILFAARMHPIRRAGDLSAIEASTLARRILSVAQQAYRTGGITNDLDRVKVAKAQGMRRAQYRHHVFSRGGCHCWTCHAEIHEEVLGGRKLFLCPSCQPQPKRALATRRKSRENS